MVGTIPTIESPPPDPAISPQDQREKPFRLGRTECRALLRRIVKAGLLIIACDALKLPFTAILVFLGFLFYYYQRRPSTVDLLVLGLAVGPLLGPNAIADLPGLPDVRFQWCFVGLLLVSLSRDTQRPKRRFPSNGLDGSMLFFFAVCLLSIVTSIMYRTPFRTFLEAMLVPLGYYLVAKRCIRKPDFLPKLYLAALMSLLAFGALGLYEAVTKKNLLDYGEASLDVFRVNGPMRMAEDYGICMTMLLVFCVSMRKLAKEKLVSSFCQGLSYLLGVSSVFFTFTRGIWLSLTTAVVVMLARRKTVLFLVGLPVVALFAWVVLDFVVPQLSGDIWEKRVTNQKTINARLATYKSAWAMFLDHPFLGVGFAAFGEVQERNPRYQTEFRGEPAVDTPHSYFLSIASEMGLLGLSAALLMVAHIFWFAWRSVQRVQSPLERNYGEAVMAVTVAYLVAGLGNDFTRNIDFVNKYFFLFLGGLSGLIDLQRSRTNRRGQLEPSSGGSRPGGPLD